MFTEEDKDTALEKIKKLFDNVGISAKLNEEGIKKIFGKVQLSTMTKDDGLKQSLVSEAKSSIGGILTSHKKLQPFASELVKIFEDYAPKESELFQSIAISYSSQSAGKTSDDFRQDKELDRKLVKELASGYNNLKLNLQNIVEDISKIADDKNLDKKFGKIYAQEFRDQISSMNDDFNKEKNIETKADKLSENLESLNNWSENYKQKLNANIFGKITSVISSCIKAVYSFINKDSAQFKKHTNKASQRISEIINKDSMNDTLSKTQGKTTKSKDNVTEAIKNKKSFTDGLIAKRNAKSHKPRGSSR